MPGLATRLLIAQRALDSLKAAGAPEAALIEANLKWYRFGALGPALGDFVPFETTPGPGGGRSPYYSVWVEVLRLAVGDPTDGTPGVVPALRTFKQFQEQVSKLVKDHDFSGLLDLKNSGGLEKVKQASADLSRILRRFSDKEKLAEIGRKMGRNSKPPLLNPSTLIPPRQWNGRDWLHWKRPGTFASTLRARAQASGDDRFIAYALGWTAAYATLVCGTGFMNSLVGSSYRNHWWRTRFIGNFVDTWVWGFYGAKASMSATDEPAPPYASWPALCHARLHEEVDLTGGLDAEEAGRRVVAEEALPHVLPPEFTAFWVNAWKAAYAVEEAPLFTEDRLQAAYLMLWIQLWFQTSGDVVGCNPQPSGTPPSACADKTPPVWVDPTLIDPATNAPFKAPSPVAKHDPDVGEIISGILLALAGVASCFLGGAAVGLPALAGGIGLIADGVMNLNWDELECHLYWTSVYLFKGLDALHKLTVFAGLQHPFPGEFTSARQQVQFNDSLPLSYLSAANVCKSRAMEGLHVPWTGALSTWNTYPSGTALEMPLTHVWPFAGRWPSAIVEDTLANGATWDLAVPPPGWPGGIQGSFGPAVQASVSLIRSPRPLPDWNLDNDRGLGWLTWELSRPYAEPVDAKPEGQG
ncbi:hypothetical protein [Stigmatella erecta]|uniref:Uncharacterized protein n=1 Tax=Stigmatella erecta TaxID=83460 RepID=A0A1I0DKB4_9BACT|nr:hypothetical protein [Stigmatella erecta]SET32923.1 hypothetical protein SAMN05443639_102576 [Stigmatella erecta]